MHQDAGNVLVVAGVALLRGVLPQLLDGDACLPSAKEMNAAGRSPRTSRVGTAVIGVTPTGSTSMPAT